MLDEAAGHRFERLLVLAIQVSSQSYLKVNGTPIRHDRHLLCLRLPNLHAAFWSRST